MDAFGNQLSVRTTLDRDGFFNLLDWFRTHTRTSSPLDWVELRDYNSSKVGVGETVVLIYLDPAKAVLHPEAWGELLQILGFKEQEKEKTLDVEKVCQKCGATAGADAKFCSVCGTALTHLKVID